MNLGFHNFQKSSTWLVVVECDFPCLLFLYCCSEAGSVYRIDGQVPHSIDGQVPHWLDDWLMAGMKNMLHVNLRIQNFQNSWTWLVVVGGNFRFCVYDCSMPQWLNDWLMTENTWFASTHTHMWCTWSYTIPNSCRIQLLQMESTFNSLWLLCVSVCVWWLTTPLAYWFTQHRECVATTNSGMWPKSLNRRAQWGCPVDKDPNAKSKILGFIIKPIKEPASSHLATTFWNV